MKLLEISKADMIQKMPKDFILNVDRTYKDRKNWKTVRLLDIKKTNKSIYKKDGNVEAYKEAVNNISKLHSSANKVA